MICCKDAWCKNHGNIGENADPSELRSEAQTAAKVASPRPSQAETMPLDKVQALVDFERKAEHMRTIKVCIDALDAELRKYDAGSLGRSAIWASTLRLRALSAPNAASPRCRSYNGEYACRLYEGHDGNHQRGNLEWSSSPSSGQTKIEVGDFVAITVVAKVNALNGAGLADVFVVGETDGWVSESAVEKLDADDPRVMLIKEWGDEDEDVVADGSSAAGNEQKGKAT